MKTTVPEYLIQRCLKGERKAQRELYDLTLPYLRAIVQRHLYNSQEWKDVAYRVCNGFHFNSPTHEYIITYFVGFALFFFDIFISVTKVHLVVLSSLLWIVIQIQKLLSR